MQGSVASNCLKNFYYREEHQTVCSIQHAEFALHVATVSSSSMQASTVISMLNQDLLITLPYPVSVKIGKASLPDNRPLVYLLTIALSAFTSQNLHSWYHPSISEFNPNDYNPVRYTWYTASSSMFHSHIHETLLENSNISDLKVWALTTLPFCWVLFLWPFFEMMGALFKFFSLFVGVQGGLLIPLLFFFDFSCV